MWLIFLPAAAAVILLARGARFRPKPAPEEKPAPVAVDGERAVSHLRQMLRLQTVSAEAARQSDQFVAFRALLKTSYPVLHQLCPPESFGSGLLYRIPGRAPDRPAVLMGHYDVVPADEAAWDKPPFDAVLEDGVLWGRGALDMKNQLCCMLEAAETLLSGGFVPERDVYLALSGEEEIMGDAAQRMRDALRDRGLRPRFVLDEGGDILPEFFPGVPGPCAMIGIGEKGNMNVELSVEGPGGHASTPPAVTPLGELAAAVVRLERHPFPARITPALDRFLNEAGRHAGFWTRVLLANRRLLRPLVFLWVRRRGGRFGAMTRTTFAPTRASGSEAGNVLPTRAAVFANLRLLAGDSVDSALARMRRIVRDPKVTFTLHKSENPRPDSVPGAEYDALCRAIRETWPDAAPTPYLMVACTDARHWRDLCDEVYRFSAKAVTLEEKATVHGNNERIRIENTQKGAAFYQRLMRRL